jgi:hypothetical protein
MSLATASACARRTGWAFGITVSFLIATLIVEVSLLMAAMAMPGMMSLKFNTILQKHDTVTDEEIAEVERKLNNRPRKCLLFRTPNEAMRLAA